MVDVKIALQKPAVSIAPLRLHVVHKPLPLSQSRPGRRTRIELSLCLSMIAVTYVRCTLLLILSRFGAPRVYHDIIKYLSFGVFFSVIFINSWLDWLLLRGPPPPLIKSGSVSGGWPGRALANVRFSWVLLVLWLRKFWTTLFLPFGFWVRG